VYFIIPTYSKGYFIPDIYPTNNQGPVFQGSKRFFFHCSYVSIIYTHQHCHVDHPTRNQNGSGVKPLCCPYELCKGLYYPVMWGLCHKPSNKNPVINQPVFHEKWQHFFRGSTFDYQEEDEKSIPGLLYNPHITGWYNPVYTISNKTGPFSIAQIDFFNEWLITTQYTNHLVGERTNPLILTPITIDHWSLISSNLSGTSQMGVS